jgi:NAD(P)H-quinone oxidoreductase subunit I
MTEEYELAAYDRHSLNYDNVALGRLPTSVTTDPSVQPLRELSYLPKGVMDPHDVPANQPRAGQLPAEALKSLSLQQDSLQGDEGESLQDAPDQDQPSG